MNNRCFLSGLCRRQESEARRTVERKFGIEAMVNAYMKVYDDMLAGRKWTSPVVWKT